MKIMAIDYGDNRTGVALSDATGFLTGRTFLIKSRKQDAVIEQLLALAREQGSPLQGEGLFCKKSSVHTLFTSPPIDFSGVKWYIILALRKREC